MTRTAISLTLAMILTSSTAFAGSAGRPPARTSGQPATTTPATPATTPAMQPAAPAPVAAPTPAKGQQQGVQGVQVLAPTQKSVVSALRAAGYNVEVKEKTEEEDINIIIKTKSHVVDVWLSSCVGDRCDRVTASVGWDTNEAIDNKLLNDWNSNYYTQAYYFENQYFIDSHLLIRGGVTAGTLQAWVQKLISDAKEFETMLK